MIEAARNSGLKTSAMFGPQLPFLSDSQAAIGTMLDRAADLHIDKIWVDALNPRPQVWPAVVELLRASFPDVLQEYRKILFDESTRAAHLAEIRTRVERAARQLGLSGRVAACM